MLPLIGIAAGLIPSIAGLFTGGKQRKAAKQMQSQADAQNAAAMGYGNQILGQSKDFLQEARVMHGGRMAGAGQAEQNIYGAQANALGSAQRNAMDASQLLAIGGASQGATQDAFQNLAAAEAQDKERRYGNVQSAQQGVQSAMGNMQNLNQNLAMQSQQAASQLGQASQQNTANALNGIGNVGMMAGMGMFGNLFGNGSTQGPTAGRTTSVQGQQQLSPFQFTPPTPAPRVNLALPVNNNLSQINNPYKPYLPPFMQ